MSPLIPSLPLTDSSLESFQLKQCGSLRVAAGPCKFGFQVEVTPSVVLAELFVALVEKDSLGSQRIGFGVRIDWERGEIWDVVNGTGIVGWLDESWMSYGSNIPVCFEIERLGSALLPRLMIGNEEWLYPARRSTSALHLAAVVGCVGTTLHTLEPDDVFDEPRLWTSQR